MGRWMSTCGDGGGCGGFDWFNGKGGYFGDDQRVLLGLIKTSLKGWEGLIYRLLVLWYFFVNQPIYHQA
jgi:hypothetical protein